ncbi:MAG: hypothetical protein EBZ48_17365, partial [Proteobacteria bacterium]|nr:hypothetical protein [Pseudomonadota bacterium]
MLPALSDLASLPLGIGQVFSLQSALGTRQLSDLIPHSNGTLPLASMLSLWLLGGRMFRMRLGLLPIMVTILLMLGTDPQASKLLQGFTSGDLSTSLQGPSTGWLTTLLIIGGAWLLLGGGLFSLPTLIGVGAVAYLVHSRDYRLAHLLQYSGSSRMLYGLVAVGVLLALLRALRPRYYYSGRFSNSFGISGGAVRSALMYCGGALALLTVYLIFTNPARLELAIPGWRSGAAVA